MPEQHTGSKRLEILDDKEDPEALYDLGWRYELGVGVDQDREAAFKYYMRAAEQKHTYAQIEVGHMYAMGRVVRKAPAEALKWYSRAADQGCVQAQHIVGEVYRTGTLVNKDCVVAYMWFYLAVNGKDASYKVDLAELDQIAAMMTKKQIYKAKRLAAKRKRVLGSAGITGS